MTTPYHNLTDAMLANAIGEADAKVKAAQARLKAARAEFLGRNLENAEGGRFTVTKSEAVRWTLDQKALKAEFDEDWFTSRSRQAHVVSLRVTVNKAALREAA